MMRLITIFGVALVGAFFLYSPVFAGELVMDSGAVVFDDGVHADTATTTFRVEVSDGGVVSMSSDVAIKGVLSEYGGTIEFLSESQEGIVTLTFTGLTPSRTYYRYVDHLAVYETVQIDEDGEYGMELTLGEESHFVWLMERPSTYIIDNGTLGGDCGQVGTWEDATKTCTLSGDVDQAIQIGTRVAGSGNGVTLNGNGKTFVGNGTSFGVYVYKSDNVTVKNMRIENVGIALYGNNSSGMVFEDSKTYDTLQVVRTNYGVGLTVRRSSFFRTHSGVFVYDGADIHLEALHFTSIGDGSVMLGFDAVQGVVGQDITIEDVGGEYYSSVFIRSSADVDLRDMVTPSPSYFPLIVIGNSEEQLRHEVRMEVDGVPLMYTSRSGGTVDGKVEPAGLLYCVLCRDVTIQNQALESNYGGLEIIGGERMTVKDNVFNVTNAPALVVSGSDDVVVHENEFHLDASEVPLKFTNMSDSAEPILFYNNALYYDSHEDYWMWIDDAAHQFSQLSIEEGGGNWWERYDEPSEGCFDVDENSICDEAFALHSNVRDNFPWTTPFGWRTGDTAPQLTLPVEEPYAGVRGVASSGPNPERGLANGDVFTFKVVYTDVAGTAPESVEVDAANTRFAMAVDTGATDAALFDGDFTNGEQYVATSTFEQGGQYVFIATVADREIFFVEDAHGQVLQFTAGYSSVAFMPGMQSSRLFKEGFVFEDQLWEPNIDGDARALTMTNDGTSLDEDIYTKTGPDGVLDEVLDSFGNIYKSFLGDLKDWKGKDNLIADYTVLPYDWRLAFDGVLEGGKVDDGKLYYDASYATGTPFIFSELERLAFGSDSGRVTIVAHSMGGLLVKKLLADIEDDESHPYRHLLDRIDTVMLVASPQLGTPKAVASLLHGTGQDFWPLAKKETIRRTARNMPGAYTLVPSVEYFSRVFDVAEDGTETPTVLIEEWNGDLVNSYGMMRNYFTKDFGDATNDLLTPLQPRADFLDEVRTLHERIDGWMPPDMDGDGVPDFQVVQIAGWGMAETLKGIEYVLVGDPTPCPNNALETCYEYYTDVRPILTHDGDETVVLPSAVAMGEEHDEEMGLRTWYVDMKEYNKGPTKDQSHASILEIDQLRHAIRSLMLHEEVSESYMYTDTSTLFAPESYLRLAVHSPVDVSVVDLEESRVGLRTTEEGVQVIEKEISNSYYFEFGEGKYLGVPLIGTEYTIELAGTDEGVFTFELVEERDGAAYQTQSFVEVPVTSSLQASFTLNTLDEVSFLHIDTNGDGTVDELVFSEEYKETITFSTLRQAIELLDSKAKKLLLTKTRLAESFAQKGRDRLVLSTLQFLEHEIAFLAAEKRPPQTQVSEQDALHITSLIQELIRQFEE